MDPRTGLDDVEKRKFLTQLGLELRPPQSFSPQPVAIPTEPSRPYEESKDLFLASEC
jgi:hypothetical protein